ncbi:MAG TPA: type II toxin-antitoxin system VapC family toxin [Desulfuromonadales bacterium]|nr:type II toxin-antitoxin system VapC family toxin [Desulfuromonadales bacterium]
MITVLDASAAISLAMNLPEATRFQPIIDSSDMVVAPDLFVSEVSNAIWKYVKAGVLDPLQGECVLERAVGLVDTFEPAVVLYREAFAVSIDQRHPVYDALYLVLARRYNGVLATLDRRLSDVATKLHIRMVQQ